MPRYAKRPTYRKRTSTRRRRAPKRKRAGWLARHAMMMSWLVSLTFIAVVAYVFLRLSWPELTVRMIEVAGAHRLSDKEVSRMAGVAAGDHLCRISPAEICRRLEANPIIEKARVRRCIPDTVRIEVTERTPLFVLADPRGRRFYVDAHGIRFESQTQKNQAQAAGLPIMFLNSDIKEKKAIQIALLCLEMGHGFSHYAVSQVGFAADGSMALKLDSGLRIELGTADRVYEKLRVAGRVLASNTDLYERGECLNVASPNEPAFRMKSASAGSHSADGGDTPGG